MKNKIWQIIGIAALWIATIWLLVTGQYLALSIVFIFAVAVSLLLFRK